MFEIDLEQKTQNKKNLGEAKFEWKRHNFLF